MDALRAQNQSSSIHRLPPEVLTSVFRLVTSSLPLSGRPRALNVLGIVCAYWRALLLDDKQAWSFITHLDPDYVKCMLGRSGAHPLTVAVVVSSINLDVLSEIFKHSERIILLNIAADTLHPVMDLLLLGSEEWPLLEHLAITLLKPGQETYTGSLRAPKLSSLTLERCEIVSAHQLPVFATSLRKLSLINNSIDAPPLSTWFWRTVLAEASEIEELVLCHFMGRFERNLDDEERQPIIHLGSLRRYQIEGYVWEISAMLQLFLFPLYTTIDVRIDLRPQMMRSQTAVAGAIRVLVESLLPFLAPPEDPLGASVTVTFSPGKEIDDIELNFSVATSDQRWIVSDRLQVTFLDSRFFAMFIMRHMCHMASILNVNEFIVKTDPILSFSAISSFHPFKILILCSLDVDQLLRSLSRMNFADCLQIFEKTEQVVLRDVELNGRLDWINLLTTTLAGTNVRHIAFEKVTGVPPMALDILRVHFPRVTWDGYA
jgi:hypothetical protein